MKQVSLSPFLGIVDDKKWCPVFLFGRPKTHFFGPQITENGRFGMQKIGSSDPNFTFIPKKSVNSVNGVNSENSVNGVNTVKNSKQQCRQRKQ